MKPSQVLAFALAFSSLSSASWLDMLTDGKALAGLEGMFVKRQDDGETTAKPTPKPTPSKSSSEEKPQESGKDPKATGKETGTATAKGSGGTKTTGKPKATEFDPRLPAGGIQMMTPGPFAGPQFYRVGDWVTFGWNYTSLSVTPTAIDILATCTKNQATYTLAVNQTVEATGQVLWDTAAVQSPPLLTETYTLLIYDAESSVSATPKAGYLAVYNQFTFGMYTPQPYTPFSDFRCPTCNSGSSLSASERQTLGFLFAMGTITVLSFTWFANGFGIF